MEYRGAFLSVSWEIFSQAVHTGGGLGSFYCELGEVLSRWAYGWGTGLILL